MERSKCQKYTHPSLKENQYLLREVDILDGWDIGLLGYICEGYTNEKRDKSLDGEYLSENLIKIENENN